MKNRVFTYVPIIAALLIIGVTFYTHSNSLFFIKPEHEGIINEKWTQSILAISTIFTSSIRNEEFHDATIVVPLVDGVKEPKFPVPKGIGRMKIVLFGEHDNLNKFIGTSNRFQADSHRRRSPWSVYNPNMRTDLKLATSSDHLYCSNIGSTIPHAWDIYPLVWEYSPHGIPILLAAANVKDGVERVFYGDSDPIVPYLSPYNLFFLQTLFSVNSVYSYLALTLVCFCIVFVYRSNAKFAVVVIFISAVMFILVQFTKTPSPTIADFQVYTDKTFLSPHYEHDVGSTPAAIVKAGYSICINHNVDSDNSVYLLSGCTKRKNIEIHSGINVIFMAPGSEFLDGSIHYTCLTSPLGVVASSLSSEAVVRIVSARNIQGPGLEKPVVQIGNVILVGTDSPQRNVHIIKQLIEANSSK